MPIQSEAVLEENLIKKLMSEGYERVIINNEDDLKKNLKKQLEKYNNIEFTDYEFDKVLTHLESGTIFDKAKKLRGKYPLAQDDGPPGYISFFNSDNWCKNCFQITNQINIEGRRKNRYDVTILINGLPLIQIELKRKGIELKKAFNQIKRYSIHSFKGLFNYPQIFIISNGVNTRYFANGPLKDLKYEFTFNWKDKDNNNINRLNEFTELFLEKCHMSKMIAKYMILNETEQKLIVLRPYQYYAVESLVHRALETNNSGYIWHTTGSGKTLTSFKASQILEKEKSIDKVIFVVDRKDLDTQTFEEFNKFSNNSVDDTKNTGILVKQLNNKSQKLVITTIQKLTRAIKWKQLKIDVKDKKIIMMFDECHRSQFGKWHTQIKKFFTNIQMFGFTGTPILPENAYDRTTKDLFEEKLHTYSIKDGICDRNVLGFSVDYIKTFKSKNIYDELVENIDKEEVYGNKKRLELIVDYIIDNHDRKTHNREFNALFAVSKANTSTNFKPVMEYYNLFKSKDHDLKIVTIFSYNPNEEFNDKHSMDMLEEAINDYNNMMGKNFSLETYQEYRESVSEEFKKRKIDILIVVDMFLTGFDSKYLNTLYVDKNLQYHGLIQAFSRTNRIYNSRKSHGHIVCFRNLKENTDNAIALYSDDNTTEYVLMGPYDQYLREFKKVLDKLYKLTPTPDSVDDLETEDDLKDFVTSFRELLKIMNLLETFTEFTFNDTGITEEEFDEYKSKYLDTYENTKTDHGDGKVSILDDIDFELELVTSDKINVTYILELLKKLNRDDDTFEKNKKNILEDMKKSMELRSKIDLIEKFIDENLPQIDDKDNIEDEFTNFIDHEKDQAIKKLSHDENLKEDNIRDVIIEYEETGKFRDDNIKSSFIKSFKFLERRVKVVNIKKRIEELAEKYNI